MCNLSAPFFLLCTTLLIPKSGIVSLKPSSVVVPPALDLVGYLEDRFSHDTAKLVYGFHKLTWSMAQGIRQGTSFLLLKM